MTATTASLGKILLADDDESLVRTLTWILKEHGYQVVATPGGVAMRDAFKRIVEELGVQYTLSYEPPAKKDGKWHSIEVQVSKPNLTIRARKGYNAPKK